MSLCFVGGMGNCRAEVLFVYVTNTQARTLTSLCLRVLCYLVGAVWTIAGPMCLATYGSAYGFRTQQSGVEESGKGEKSKAPNRGEDTEQSGEGEGIRAGQGVIDSPATCHDEIWYRSSTDMMKRFKRRMMNRRPRRRPHAALFDLPVQTRNVCDQSTKWNRNSFHSKNLYDRSNMVPVKT